MDLKIGIAIMDKKNDSNMPKTKNMSDGVLINYF